MYFKYLEYGEKLIYTAHGLLAATSDSGVFSLHQFILFRAFFRCVNNLYAKQAQMS